MRTTGIVMVARRGNVDAAIEYLAKRRRTGKGLLGIAQSQRPPTTPWTGANFKQNPSIIMKPYQ